MEWDDARARAALRALFDAAVAAADPRKVLAAHLPPKPASGRCIVVGGGKSAAVMAAALEDAWPDVDLRGAVVTRYGHAVPTRRIEVIEASHPVPDANSERGARRLLDLVRGLGSDDASQGLAAAAVLRPSSPSTDRRPASPPPGLHPDRPSTVLRPDDRPTGLQPDDLVIALMSGGASALLSAPAPGLTLADKQAVNRALLACGANITEMNAVRKHLSMIKGGRLAALAAPARVVTLAISDVPGDDPAVIGSGPTVPDATTYAQAREVVARYRLDLPEPVRACLDRALDETPKPGTLPHAEFRMIATPMMALNAVAEAARGMGLTPLILGDALEGEARELGIALAGMSRAVALHGHPVQRPAVLLSGGETTVTLGTGPTGHGGTQHRVPPRPCSGARRRARHLGRCRRHGRGGRHG